MRAVQLIDSRIEQLDVLLIDLPRLRTREAPVLLEYRRQAPVLKPPETPDDRPCAVRPLVAVDVNRVVPRIRDHLERLNHLLPWYCRKRLLVPRHRDRDQVNPVFPEEAGVPRGVVLRADEEHGLQAEVPEKRKIPEIGVGAAVNTLCNERKVHRGNDQLLRVRVLRVDDADAHVSKPAKFRG